MDAALKFVLQQEIMIRELLKCTLSINVLAQFKTVMDTYKKLTDLTNLLPKCVYYSEIF